MSILETYRKASIPDSELISDPTLTEILSEISDIFEQELAIKPIEISACENGKLHLTAAFTLLPEELREELLAEFGLMALAFITGVEGFTEQHHDLDEHTILHLISE